MQALHTLREALSPSLCKKPIRFSCSDVAAIAGFHPFADLLGLADKYVYQDLAMLRDIDAALLGVRFVSLEDEADELLKNTLNNVLNSVNRDVNNALHKEDAATLQSLSLLCESITHDKSTLRTQRETLQSMEKVRSSLAKAQRVLSEDERKLLANALQTRIRTTYGARCEESALDKYEAITGFPVARRNEEFFVLEVPPLFTCTGEEGEIEIEEEIEGEEEREQKRKERRQQRREQRRREREKGQTSLKSFFAAKDRNNSSSSSQQTVSSATKGVEIIDLVSSDEEEEEKEDKQCEKDEEREEELHENKAEEQEQGGKDEQNTHEENADMMELDVEIQREPCGDMTMRDSQSETEQETRTNTHTHTVDQERPTGEQQEQDRREPFLCEYSRESKRNKVEDKMEEDEEEKREGSAAMKTPSTIPSDGNTEKPKPHSRRRTRPAFVLVGKVDGVSSQIDCSSDDPSHWRAVDVVVEMKNRVSRIARPPPLYDQIQLVAYLLMTGCPVGDLVQSIPNKNKRKKKKWNNNNEDKADNCEANGSAQQEQSTDLPEEKEVHEDAEKETEQATDGDNDTSANNDNSNEEEEEAFAEFEISRVHLEGPPYHHRLHWDTVIMPRLHVFNDAMLLLRRDDSLRHSFLLSSEEEKLAILMSLCPHLSW